VGGRPESARSAAAVRGVELHAAVAERRQANSCNVAGLGEGSDPALKAETIVFSGHYDHDGVAHASSTAPAINLSGAVGWWSWRVHLR